MGAHGRSGGVKIIRGFLKHYHGTILVDIREEIHVPEKRWRLIFMHIQQLPRFRFVSVRFGFNFLCRFSVISVRFKQLYTHILFVFHIQNMYS